jgi:hypothetical protein
MKLTVCGSIAFYSEMEALKKELETRGHEVRLPVLRNDVIGVPGDEKMYLGRYVEENGGIDAFPVGHALWDMKESAIRTHYEKIEWGDAIVVANHDKRGVQGYIGGNTLIEIGVAFFLKKPIYVLNPISSDLSYKQEILGMKPVMLNGNLSKLV